MLRIKEIMKRKGLTTVDIAKLLYLSRETVSRQINNSNMTIATLQKYASILNVTVYDLFEHEQEQMKRNALICPHCNKEIIIKAEQ